jgi:hypothetical protein
MEDKKEEEEEGFRMLPPGVTRVNYSDYVS